MLIRIWFCDCAGQVAGFEGYSRKPDGVCQDLLLDKEFTGPLDDVARIYNVLGE